MRINIEEIAENIIATLDQMGRDVDGYEYGLPVDMEFQEDAKIFVIGQLKLASQCTAELSK